MAEAPFIFFDAVNMFGVTHDGTVHLTLTAKCTVRDAGGNITQTHAPVAHVRMGRLAAAQLREALDKIDLGTRPAASKERN